MDRNHMVATCSEVYNESIIEPLTSLSGEPVYSTSVTSLCSEDMLPHQETFRQTHDRYEDNLGLLPSCEILILDFLIVTSLYIGVSGANRLTPLKKYSKYLQSTLRGCESILFFTSPFGKGGLRGL